MLPSPAPAAVLTFRLLIDGALYLVDGEPMTVKAGNIPAGARWITVRPPGHEKGSPVLIQETERGSGTFHVIGGAGGKLNYLKLRGVKSAGEYAKDVRERQSAKREERRVIRDSEKRLGTHESQQAKRAAVDEQRRKVEADFIKQVAQAVGWKDEDLAPPDVDGISEEAAKAAVGKHHREVLARARAVVELQRRKLTIEADERSLSEIGEGEVPEAPSASGLGYSLQLKQRTEDQDADIKAEAEQLSEAKRTPEQRERLSATREKANKIKAELEAVGSKAEALKAKVLDTAQAVKVLKAAKQLRAAQKSAVDAKRAIDRGEAKAYVVEVGDEPSEADIVKDIENEVRTKRTRAFLDEIGKIDGYENALAKHIGVGAHNGLNGVSLATAGVGVVDRDVVDVLGTAGAAQVMAHRLRTDLSADAMEEAAAALEQYHLDHYVKRSEEALAEAREFEEAAREIQTGENADGHDLYESRELHQRRQDALGEARRVLGQALGEMEAHAALLAAMKAKKASPLEVALGKLAPEDAIRRMRAIGLQRGDYTIEHAGAEAIATITPEGMLRISKPSDREHLERTRESIAIMNGERDDPDFWPEGVARRPDLALPKVAPATPAPLSEPFTAGDDLHGSIRDYIGSRMADGHGIYDIVQDLHSQAIVEKAGGRESEYFAALRELVPLKDASGKLIENEARRDAFAKIADTWAQDRHGGKFAPIHAQTFDVGDKSMDALHRAFADEPAGPVAFKPTGELTPQDQTTLRRHFEKHIASADAGAADLRKELAAHEADEPEKEVDDMFGRGTNPEWVTWKQRADTLREQIRSRGLDWGKYVTIMGSPSAAHASVQDHLRGRVVQRFHEHHNTLNPDRPLRLGRTVMQNNLRHLDAVDPEARERRLEQHRELVDSLRNRTAGRYASGTVGDKIDASRERHAALEQSQMGFFAADEEPADAAPKPLGGDERHTLGAAAEHRLRQMAEVIGPNFRPGQPVKVFQPGMTGKYAPQQRAIKLIEQNKRVGLAQGTGSGKTNMMLSSFAHLHSKGKVKRGIFAVPSIVQGQFGSEALATLEPGRFKWHAEPGVSRAERLAAYRDPSTHFVVTTHQALRDDLLHLGAGHAGISESEMSARLANMAPADRKAWAADVMRREGMDHDYLAVDEGHDLLNRKGKANSILANTIDALSENTPYYVNASADMAGKNDLSETFDALRKLDPARFSDRDSFMRRYGIDTAAAKDALRREMAPYIYAGRIESGVPAERQEVPVQLAPEQRQAIDEIEQHVAALRLARLQGKTDLAAARALSPHSFDGADDGDHEAIAKRLSDSVGVLRETAVDGAINAHPKSAKLDAASKYASQRKGKPGVIFARNLETVQNLTKRLEAEGHRVVSITGADSGREKAAKRLKFKPEKGEPQADVLIASDAGAVGMNAQRGAWLLQMDTPKTAKTHAQRNGRIDRLGQKNDRIELADLVADHDIERSSRARLKTKYGLRDMLTTPAEGMEESGYVAYLAQARAAQRDATEDRREAA